MVAGIRDRLTYANVISTLCLFLLLGGGAYAAFSLPKDSVKSKHIVDGQVKSVDVANDLTVDSAVSAQFAQTLQGYGASQFLQRENGALGGAADVDMASAKTIVEMIDPAFRITYSCPALDINESGLINFRNDGDAAVHVYSDNGGGDLNAQQSVAPDAFYSQASQPGGEHILLGVEGPDYQATIEVFSYHRDSDDKCHAMAQAFVTTDEF